MCVLAPTTDHFNGSSVSVISGGFIQRLCRFLPLVRVTVMRTRAGREARLAAMPRETAKTAGSEINLSILLSYRQTERW